MAEEEIQEFLSFVQKACLPGIWSKGVAIARELSVFEDSRKPGEILLRVRAPGKTVSPRVSLWPEDEDYHCDCGDRVEPCIHVAAAVAALKSGTLKRGEGEKPSAPRIAYRLKRESGELLFERWIVTPDGREERLPGSLVAYVGGLQSGRVSGRAIAATQDDFAVDAAIGPGGASGKLSREIWSRLLTALRSIEGVTLEGTPIRAGTPTRGLAAEVLDDGPGFRLRLAQAGEALEIFGGGIALAGETLRLLEDPGLSLSERQALSGQGQWFGPPEIPRLVSEVLPSLERKIPVEVRTSRLPRAEQAPPRPVIELEALEEDRLRVIPRITYPSPYAVRDPEEERRIAQRLRTELHLSPGQPIELRGAQAVEFVERLKEHETTGSGERAFRLTEGLVPELRIEGESVRLEFRTANGSDSEADGATAGSPRGSADGDSVLAAWTRGEPYVRLLDGGWARLPRDWLSRYGDRVSELLAARDSRGHVPPWRRPELADLGLELGADLPDPLRELRSRLDSFERIPDLPLPPGLRADLRHYQRDGYRWLCFLRDQGMGALLADDMGLGKTLQALASIRGRTLVAAPTSVIRSWQDQAKQFRPDLKVSLHYGSDRELDPKADIVLTSHGILRLDRELLAREEWGTLILDEAQVIRNPDSQLARAAHSIPARFRIALSGTPVENRLDDLWSQLHFANPGLLGSREDFLRRFGEPISRGDPQAATRLRARIKPFLLRRLKRDVAPELPPRTETVLHCELSSAERELYDSLLISGRREVLRALDSGSNVLGALELLLRLRQACCHPSLVPGQKADTSSKLELLLESLAESIESGHRALVFSQWTSYLDLIEPKLKGQGVTFSRIDGSTSDRGGVVERFQRPDGPSVLLISLKAGGTGLTLTAADHVYILDPWWNPAAEDQAADRAHRIGQENPVLIHRLVAEGTVEDRILELQARKREISRLATEGSASGAELTRDDLRSLLEV